MNNPQLDDRIRQALPVEPSAEQLARLEHYWRRHSSPRKRRWPLAAAAATIAAVGLVAWWIAHVPSEAPRSAIVKNHPQPRPPRTNPPPLHVQAPPPVTHPMQIAVASPREATAYEPLFFAVQTGRSRHQANKPDAAAIAASIDAIEKQGGVAGLIANAQAARDRSLRAAAYDRLLTPGRDDGLHAYLSLVADERTRTEALMAITRAKDQPVDELLKILAADDRTTRLAAALVLGQINTPEVAEKLIARVTSAESSSEAWIALFACRNPTADRFLAAASQQPRLLGHLNYARIQWTQLMP